MTLSEHCENKVKLSQTQTGRAAEYLVCYMLELNGIEAHHLNSTTDILAVVKSGRVIRLEVKASNNPKQRATGVNYNFMIKNTNNADWIAFVALDIEAVIFMPIDMVKNQTVTLYRQDFAQDAQISTLQKLGDMP